MTTSGRRSFSEERGQKRAIERKERKMDNAKLTVTAPVRTWREKGGVITFSVTSNDRTGEGWIIYFKSKGIELTGWAKDLLRSPDFKPTSGITTDIVVLNGSLFTDADRVTEKIRARAKEYQFQTPNAEVACLIRDLFTDEEIKAMGLTWIVTMHDPIEDRDFDPSLLCTGRSDGDPWLSTFYVEPVSRWNRDDGFVFVVAQVSPYR